MTKININTAGKKEVIEALKELRNNQMSYSVTWALPGLPNLKNIAEDAKKYAEKRKK